MRTPTWALICCLALVATSGASAPPAEPAAKATYLVVYRPGGGWLPGKPLAQQPLAEHFKYMVSLYEKGTLRFAGPFLDDTGGAVVLEAAGEAEANAIVAADPAVTARVFVAEIHPWRMVDWERHVKKK
jgi:uncharacterized protein